MVTNPKFLQRSFLSDSSDGFEWFYFDIHTPDGNDVILIFYKQPFSLSFDVCMIDMFFYKANHLNIHYTKLYKREEVQFLENPFAIDFPEGKIVKDDGGYSIHFQDKKLSLLFNISPLVSNWNPRKFSLLSSENLNKYFLWSIWIPKGIASGEIQFKGDTHQISGYAYHDQNWGNIILCKHFKSWMWGKYIMNNGVIIYGYLIYRKGQNYQLSIHIQNDNIYVDNLERVENPSKRNLRSNFTYYPSDIHINEPKIIEDLFFYMNPMTYSLPMMRKIVDLLTLQLRQRTFLKGIYRRFANTRYRRIKADFSFRGEYYPLSFHEEMIFNPFGHHSSKLFLK